MANLAQRLYATSGRATYGDIPWLYGQLALARARAAAAQGAGSQFQGEPQKLQLAASGAAPIGGGGGDFAPPAVQAIAAPGKSGPPANALNAFMRPDDFGPGGGGGAGYGGGVNNQAGRYQDVYGRGTAPFTAEGLLAGLGNAYNVMGPGIIQTGLASMGELGLGLPPGELGGIQTIPGYVGPNPLRRRRINSLNDLFAAQQADRVDNARAALARGIATRGGLNYGDIGMGRRGIMGRGGFGGFGGGGNAGGGFGGSYGGGDRTSKGPGGTLGHI